jgi:hypothetical protein
MRKALMSTTVAACGMLGAVFATGAQAGGVGVSVNIVAPVTPGVVVSSGYYGGVPVVAQPVFVAPSRRVVVAPVVVVPVVRFRGYGHRHHHFRNDFRGRGYGYGHGYGYRY